jgi:hypothetical protein
VDQAAGHIELLGLRLSAAEAYLGPWVMGGFLGGLAAIVLDGRAGFTPVRVVAGIVFAFGFVYGATLEGRLEVQPLAEALIIPLAGLIGSGMREPLGLLVGGALALGWCRLAGIPWREAGDALSVFAAVWLAVGRIGCLLAGCCMGLRCSAWMAGICLRYPPGTLVYLDQVRDQVLDPTSPLSHPAHVLPVYFSLAALGILTALLELRRRGAPPGDLFIVFTLFYPAAKLALETLRASPRSGPVMTLVCLTIFATGLAMLTRRAGGTARQPVAKRAA